MLEASPSSVLRFVSFSCARGERAFKNTATSPAPCLWLHPHTELGPNRPSSKMLLLGPAETPAIKNDNIYTRGTKGWSQWTGTAHPLPNQTSLSHRSTQGTPQLLGGQLKEHCREQELQSTEKTMSSPLLQHHNSNQNSWPVSRTRGNYSGREPEA